MKLLQEFDQLHYDWDLVYFDTIVRSQLNDKINWNDIRQLQTQEEMDQ